MVALQAGDPETRRLWRVLVDESVAYFGEVYEHARRDAHAATTCVGESSYNEHLDEVVADLDAKGLLVESDGALCVFPPGFTNRDGEPLPLIVRKSRRGLRLRRDRPRGDPRPRRHLGATVLLYVVGTPQAQHFEMVFAVARMAGWLPATGCAPSTWPSATCSGRDHKMFKTRSGETVKLVDLLDEAAAARPGRGSTRAAAT